MSWGEVLIKIAPWLFYIASLVFMIVGALHIKHLRQKDLEEQIALQEEVLNEKYGNISDTDVVDRLNNLEGGPKGDITTKK